MTLPIDPETGSPNGPPRQVSIEKCFAWLDVSPDGDRIAFVAWTEGRKAILVVPAVGGPSRKLVEALTSIPLWAPDGESLYYSVDRFPPGEALLRVFLEDAQVDTVFTWPQHIRAFGPPERKSVVRVISRNDNDDSVWEVATLEGLPLGRFKLPQGMDSFSLTPTGELLVVRADMSTSVEVLPVDGGPPRELNLNGGRNTVLGWSPDGQRLLMKTALDGEEMYFFAATDGSLMRQVQLPEDATDEITPVVLSRDGSHILLATTGSGGGSATLRAMNLENGGIREISHPNSPVVRKSLELAGRGTTWWQDGEDFLFVEQHGSDYELRASPPSGPSRLLRTFRGELPATMGVNEDWIAYEWGPMASRSVVLARAGETETRMLITFRGYLESVSWSRDGRRLAFTAYRMPGDQETPSGPELMVLDVDPSGNVIGEPKVLNVPDMHWWSPHWLPNGRGLLVVGNDGNIWQVSLDADVRPVPVTGDLTDPVWWFQISPDGRSIAYTKNILQGSSIWRVDLGDILGGPGG
jgi:Tol biopolymer transport system component